MACTAASSLAGSVMKVITSKDWVGRPTSSQNTCTVTRRTASSRPTRIGSIKRGHEAAHQAGHRRQRVVAVGLDRVRCHVLGLLGQVGGQLDLLDQRPPAEARLRVVAEVAFLFLIVVDEALLQDQILQLGHLGPGQERGGGGELGVLGVAHVVGVDPHQHDQRHAQNGQGDHHLQQRETA
jgi:hypothetical protein